MGIDGVTLSLLVVLAAAIFAKNEGFVKIAGSEKKQEGALMGIDGVTLILLVLAAAIFALRAAKRK